MAIWKQDEETVGTETMCGVRQMADSLWEGIEAEFLPPRFVSGDCHASHFFANIGPTGSDMSGVIDMEVASAGAPIGDLFKFMVEVAGRLPAATRWWEPLLKAYGREVDFDAVRLVFFAADHRNYKCHREYSWPGDRCQILEHVLSADNWYSLFNLSS